MQWDPLVAQGILGCPQGLGMVFPIQRPGLSEAFGALSVPMGHRHIAGDMESPPQSISSSWLWFSSPTFSLELTRSY